VLAVLSGVVLGALLVFAGANKLRVPRWAEQTSVAMRLPIDAVRPTPWIELVVGAALVAQIPFAGVAALALLVPYTAVLVPRIGGPPCACFGRAATPITRWTVARNVALIALAVITLLP
jgi:hypothetical protein